jgi:hypothetical protein
MPISHFNLAGSSTTVLNNLSYNNYSYTNNPFSYNTKTNTNNSSYNSNTNSIISSVHNQFVTTTRKFSDYQNFQKNEKLDLNKFNKDNQARSPQMYMKVNKDMGFETKLKSYYYPRNLFMSPQNIQNNIPNNIQSNIRYNNKHIIEAKTQLRNLHNINNAFNISKKQAKLNNFMKYYENSCNLEILINALTPYLAIKDKEEVYKFFNNFRSILSSLKRLLYLELTLFILMIKNVSNINII